MSYRNIKMSTYKRKTEPGKTPIEVFERASVEVLINDRSPRSVAAEFDINRMTL